LREKEKDMTAEVQTEGLSLTEAAAGKVRSLMEKEGDTDLALRISVAPGGCAGLRYQLSLDDVLEDDDVKAELHGVTLVTDRMSYPYLMGATVDFVDTIEQVGFTIFNPNAAGSCACGKSFH
jgi:iron-sulfur cluster assembly accessory protein